MITITPTISRMLMGANSLPVKDHGRDRRRWLLSLSMACWLGAAWAIGSANPSAPSAAAELHARPVPMVPGQSVSLLPDGRWMFAGGMGEQGVTATIELQQDTTKTVLGVSLLYARQGHTATVLPDGTVLIVGGRGPDDRLVEAPEIIDPLAGTTRALPSSGLMLRTEHTATLLTNGEVLIAGGRDASGNALASVQLWDSATGVALPVESSLQVARYAHEAALLATGEGLLSSGKNSAGEALMSQEIYDPATRTVQGAVESDPRLSLLWANQPIMVMDSAPSNDAVDVPLNSVVGIRFNRKVAVTHLNPTTMTLVGPSGPVAGSVVGAEQGMLGFFKPAMELLPATSYTLFLRGVTDVSGQELPLSSVRFTTRRVLATRSTPVQPALATTKEQPNAATGPHAEPKPVSVVPRPRATAPARGSSPEVRPELQPAAQEDSAEDWIPRVENRHGAWRVLGLSGDPPLTASSIATPLPQAAAGVTAIAGRVLRLNGRPLPSVRVSSGSVAVTTDAQGRFLLSPVKSGSQLIRVDGRGVVSNGRHYTEHYISVSAGQGSTTSLPDPVYLPRVDPATEVAISSPADHDIVLTHPAIPGLEVVIPKGAVIREQDGTVVTKVSITPVPDDRAPYRSPVPFPVYFTLQPGGAYVDGDPSKAVKVTYPNYQGLAVGTSVDFWNYNPAAGGWQVYGHGKVSADGKRVIADESVGFRQIMAFGLSLGTQNNTPPGTAPVANGACAADPVDCATGIFSYTATDMTINDVTPISATRIYRTNDNQIRLFGVGANLSYAMVLYSTGTYTANLVRADGSQISFGPAPTGSPFEVLYTATGSPTEFDGAIIFGNEALDTWDVILRDGTTYRFNPGNNLLTAIVDRNGNQITITYQSNGITGTNPPITQITSPNGRYIQFFYDSYNRIVQAVDNAGRSTSYSYDALSRLSSVTDASSNTESYGYDPTTNNMNLVTDRRGNSMLQNQYDANARVKQQTLADGAVWQFAYSLDSNGNVVQTTITDPRGYVQQDTFNASGYTTQIVLAQGKLEQQTYTIARNSGSNLPELVTDTLGRQTLYGYDGFGDVTSATFLYGTPNAVTYTMSYDPTHHQLTGISDPLGHTTTASVDGHGNALRISDALGDTSNLSYNLEGLPTSLSDPLGHTTSFNYLAADLSSVTDALSRATQLDHDALGRLRSITDPLGNLTRFSYDAMDRLLNTTDAMSEITSFAYDQNGNLLTTTDPRNVVQTYTYDKRNRPQTYQDPAGKVATYVFDGMSNLNSVVDRKNQTTSVQYDGISRPTLITFQDSSTIAITWDGGNRATKFVDSLNGTITRNYDGLDRLTQESGPQGSVSYQYDAAGRRQTMTATGQAVVNYTFDNANRLTQVAQGTTTLGFGYDAASRRTSVTLPNGIVATYGFDNANQLTGITYKNGSTQVGTLTYGYDLGGRRTSVGGTLAGFVPPTSVASMTYDGSNRLTSWGGTALNYDADGNLTSFGSTTYTWNARNQVTANSAGSATFAYDAFGRRVSATVTGSTAAYLYDGLNPATVSGNLMLASGNLDELFALVTSSATTSFLRDGVNSTVALTSASGTISGNYYYSPYGDTGHTGSLTTAFQFTGRENDGATGLYYYRARYYAPELGRFISEDALGFRSGTNLYAYANGDPILNIDPLGLWSFTFGGYAGIGTEITFGRECGHWFVTDRFGFGIGGGFMWDPKGGVPGGTGGTPYGGVLSVSGQAGANLGPVGGNLELGVERNYQTRESKFFGGKGADLTSDRWGLHGAASFGGQITLYGH